MDAESYDVQGIPYIQEEDRNSLLKQVSDELIADNPSYGFQVKFHAENVTVTYHSYEMDLQLRMKEVEEQCTKLFKEWVKNVKKEFKKRAKKTLKLKEDKDADTVSVEKVSLNSRYYYRHSKTYSMV